MIYKYQPFILFPGLFVIKTESSYNLQGFSINIDNFREKLHIFYRLFPNKSISHKFVTFFDMSEKMIF